MTLRQIKLRLYNMCIPYNNMNWPRRTITRVSGFHVAEYKDGWPRHRQHYAKAFIFKASAYLWLLYIFNKHSPYSNKKIYPRLPHYYNIGFRRPKK